MPDLERIRITRDPGGDNVQYDFFPLEEIDGRQSKPAFSIAPPGQAPQDNIFLGISGMDADLPIRWWLYDNGEDRSNGTAGGVADFPSNEVVTLNEQIRWVENHIHAPSFDATWELDHIEGPRTEDDIPLFDGDEVYVERVELPKIQRDSPRWLEARAELRRGGSI